MERYEAIGVSSSLLWGQIDDSVSIPLVDRPPRITPVQQKELFRFKLSGFPDRKGSPGG